MQISLKVFRQFSVINLLKSNSNIVTHLKKIALVFSKKFMLLFAYCLFSDIYSV